jgi:nucleotide-binding universal stress UspA family protein
METTVKLIALVDGSPYSASVCDHAAWAAGRIGAGVEVFHMLGRRERPSVPADLSGNLRLGARSALLDELARSDADRAKLVQARGRLILEEAAVRLASAGVASVETRLRNDDIVATVREFEPGAAMVVIGKRGEAHGFALDHLGSNLERILRSATRPVLVASRAFQPVSRYLIAFDGSPSILKAIDQIAAGKLLAGLSCHLLHVGADHPDMRARLEGAAALLRGSAADVSIDIRQGEPEKIVAEAVESDAVNLLVIGAYGHSRIRSLIIGSTSAALVRLCKVPVLMFR